ncbi:MAG: WD40/YVTN/BNR-like repeat-containing protein [Saprospiraceae bacterium]
MKLKMLFTLSFLITLTFNLDAQQIDVEQLKGMKIRNIGPAGMSGRVTSIDVVQSNTSIIYAGTASGGVWKSTSGGITWKPIFDKQPLSSIGSLTIQQSNPDVIWVGTGEGNPRNSFNSGEGIYKSIDGGRNWKLMGLEKTRVIHRIIIDKTNPDIVYVAALGSAWGKNAERGVYKTTDGGKTWKKTLYINDETGCADLVVDPTNPNKVIAAMWEHSRTPWFFNSGGKNSGLYVTYDGGENWEKRTDEDGLPKGDLGRIGLAIATNKPNIVYALVEAKKNGLYRSEDGGFTWKLQANKNIGGRPFYYADIFVDPSNENRIFNIHSMVDISEDGGKTFRVLLPYSGVHPDHHAWWIDPNNPNFMIDGNDGGMNITRNGGETWRFVDNIPLAQYYHINVDNQIPYNIYGGMQDNGSWIGPSEVWKRGGIRNYDFQEVFFGDGFDVLPRRDNPRYGFAMSQGGNLGYYDRVSGLSQFVRPVHPEDTVLRFNWNAALAQNPFADCGIYYGSQFVHKSMDCGQTWEIISPDLTTNNPEKQKANISGGLTMDATQAENHTTILAIAPSPHDANVIWVGTDDGNLQLTRDGGKSWNNLIGKLPNCPKNAWIPYIEVSKTNKEEVFIIVNNYRQNDFTPYAYKTTDLGKTWTRIANQDNVKGHTLSIVQDPKAPNLLFLGTDYGLYISFDGGSNWNKWKNDYPSVSTRDLKIQEREGDLVVGTFGRAAWVLDDIRPLRAIAKSKAKVLDKSFELFDAPYAWLHENRSFDGVRFDADGGFRGDNANANGAMLTLWVKPKKEATEEKPTDKEDKKGKKSKKKREKAQKEKAKEKSSEKKKEGKKKKDSPKKAQFKVYNTDGELIRNFSRKLKEGINRVFWYLDEDGGRFPSYREPKKDADPNGGVDVLPGTYKIVAHWGDIKDSTMVEVKIDPNLEVTTADMKARRQAIKDYEKLTEKAANSFDQLKQAKKTIKLVESQLVNAPDSIQKEVKEMGETINIQLDSLMKLYMQPRGLKGIQRAPNNLTGKLYAGFNYLRRSAGAPSQNAQNAVNNFENAMKEVHKGVNVFFEKDWKNYQEAVEKLKYSLFEAVEKF